MSTVDATLTPSSPRAPGRSATSSGGIALLVIGALLLFFAVGLLAAGGVLRLDMGPSEPPATAAPPAAPPQSMQPLPYGV